MKKLLLALIIGIGLGGVVFFTTRQLSDQSSIPSPSPTPREQQMQTEPVVTKTADVVIANPQTVIIPKLGVHASVEHVGLDSENRMDVPKDYRNVAWYELGFKPGEKGSAVIAGHFDTPSGSPGVFYGIESLTPGDEIIIEGSGEKLTYSVVETHEYAFNQVPLEAVFNSKDNKRLNLITCDGVFDQATQNYSNRLIVYAVMDE